MPPENGLIRCPICSYCFDASAPSLCEACPLNTGCTMLCCPSCGHTTVDPDSSRLVNGLRRMVAFFAGPFPPQQEQSEPTGDLTGPVFREATSPASPPGLSLDAIPVGECAEVINLAPEMPLHRRQALLAYGVEPGKCLHLLQQSPLTVLRVDQMELALEKELARLINVASPNQSPGCGGGRGRARRRARGAADRRAV